MATKKRKPLNTDELIPPVSQAIPPPWDEAFDGNVAFRELPSVCAQITQYAQMNKMTDSHAARALLRIGMAAVAATKHEGILR